MSNSLRSINEFKLEKRWNKFRKTGPRCSIPDDPKLCNVGSHLKIAFVKDHVKALDRMSPPSKLKVSFINVGWYAHAPKSVDCCWLYKSSFCILKYWLAHLDPVDSIIQSHFSSFIKPQACFPSPWCKVLPRVWPLQKHTSLEGLEKCKWFWKNWSPWYSNRQQNDLNLRNCMTSHK